MNIYYNPNRAGAAGKAGKAWWGCRFSFKQAEATLLKAKLNWLYRWNKVWLLHMGALFYFYFIFYLCSCPWYGRKTLKYHKNFLKITLQTPVCFALLTVSHRHPPPPPPPAPPFKNIESLFKGIKILICADITDGYVYSVTTSTITTIHPNIWIFNWVYITIFSL